MIVIDLLNQLKNIDQLFQNIDNNIDNNSLIVLVSLDFYEAFDMVEHYFLFKAPRILVLVQTSNQLLKCFMKILTVVSYYNDI